MKLRAPHLAMVLAAGLCMQPLTAAANQGDWLIRAGVGIVDPKSDNLSLSPTDELQVDTGTSATIEGTYMFADHWGVELLAAWPFNHDVNLQSATGEAKVAEAKHLPPTLSLQYHFNPDGTFRPYVGAGLNYTMFMDEKTTGALAGTNLSLDDSWGLAGQVGVDYGISEKWFLNAAVRYIDIDSDATLNGADIGTVEIDPFVYEVQVGYRFGRAAPAVAAAAAAPPPPPPPPPAPPPPAPRDSDNDGVVDAGDQCPDTPRGDRVGPQGCSCDVVRQVQFALNSADLTAEGKAQLDEMAVNLNRLKFVAGTVVGHTDNSGPETYNEKLSERRAQTVADYLQAKGIAQGRLKVSGAGESEPVADNKTAEGRAQNRRVVLKRTDCDAGT